MGIRVNTSQAPIRVGTQQGGGITDARVQMGGGGGGGSVDLTDVRDQINLAYGVANTANQEANLAFMAANGAYNKANSANIVAFAAFETANAGFGTANIIFTLSNAAYDKANSANLVATASFGVANNANVYANLAFRAANAAFDFANTINIHTDAAFATANIANLRANLAQMGANAAYDFANSVNIKVDAISIVANTANLYANLAFRAANGAFDKANVANGTADAAFIVANVANARANLAQMASNAAYDKANTANLLALAAFNSANNSNAWANYAMIVANAAFVQANAANLLAVGNTLSNGFFIQRASRSKLNFIPASANVRIEVVDDAAGDRINVSIEAMGSGGGSGTGMNLTAGNTLANGFYFTRTTALANIAFLDESLLTWNVDVDTVNYRINVAPTLSRAPFVMANNANAMANAAYITANAAFGVANTANLYANLAFRAANAAYDFANVINTNVAATMVVANTANLYANLAFRAANAAYDFANTINIKTDAAFAVANNANLYANLAFRAANAVYDFANTININVAATMIVANVANARANLAQMASNAAYNFANTININVAATMVVANNANVYANLAFMAANGAFDKANAANSLAFVKFDKTGGTVSGNVAIRQERILALNTALDLTADWANTGVQFTMIRANIANIANASANSFFLDFQANSASKFNISTDGSVASAWNVSANIVVGSWGGIFGGMNIVPAIIAAFFKANTTGVLSIANTLQANSYVATRSTGRSTLNFVPGTDIVVEITDDIPGDRSNIKIISTATAGVSAGEVFDATNAAFFTANTANQEANLAFMAANAAFNKANAANVLADSKYDKTGGPLTGNVAIRQPRILSDNIAVDIAVDWANTAQTFTVIRANVANIANAAANSLFINFQANSAPKFNVDIWGNVETVTNVTSNISIAKWGVISGGLNVTPAIISSFGVANNANLYANLAFRAANAAYDFANTININVASTMVVANTANLYANLAFMAANGAFEKANAANLLALAAFNGANNANAWANYAMIAVNAAFSQANVANTNSVGNTYSNGYFALTTTQRTRLNFVPQSNDVKVLVSDDSAGDRANITIGVPGVGPSFDKANVANSTADAASIVANNANLYANLAFMAANAVYGFANTINVNVAATMVVANTANLYANLAFRAANAVYDFANTININVAATMIVANTANVRANLAQMASNAAYDFANTINTIARSAFTQANSSNLIIVGNTMSNGYYATRATRTRLNFVPASANVRINVDDDSVGDRINVTIEAMGSGGGGSGTGANLTAANTLANGYSVVRTLPYANINFIGDTLTDFDVTDDSTHYQINVKVRSSTAAFAQANAPVYVAIIAPASPVANSLWWNPENAVLSLYYADSNSSQWVDVSSGGMTTIGTGGGGGPQDDTIAIAAFDVANNANLYANLAFRAANAAYDFANTMNINVAATMIVANNANVYANLAFMAANAVYAFANTININVAATMVVANTGNLYANLAFRAANAAYDFANAINIKVDTTGNALSNVANTYSNGYVVLQSSRGTLNFMADTTDLKIRIQDNSTHGLTNVRFDAPGIGLAYGVANAAKTEADAVFGVANVHNGAITAANTIAIAAFDVANAHNGAMAQMNVAIFGVANNANLYANLAFRAANAAYDFANTININVAATMIVANTANARANLAQMASNAAFGVANLALPAAGGTITGDLKVDGLIRGNMVANVINILSQGVGSNTGYLRVNTGNVHIYSTPAIEIWQLWSNTVLTYNAFTINVQARSIGSEGHFFSVLDDGSRIFRVSKGSGGDTIAAVLGPQSGSGPRFQIAIPGESFGRINFGINGTDGVPGLGFGDGTNARDIGLERLNSGNVRVTDYTTNHNYANLIASNITAQNTVTGIEGRFTNRILAGTLNVEPTVIAAFTQANAAMVQANTSNNMAVGNTIQSNSYFTIRGNRTRLNFLEGSGVTINVDEDAVGDRVNVTISKTAGGGMIQLSDDTDPELGGELDGSGFSIMGVNEFRGTGVHANVISISSTDGNVIIGEGSFGNKTATTDYGIQFGVESGRQVSGLTTEVDGAIMTLGTNVYQLGDRDTAQAGGIFRFDTRAANREFTVIAQQPGDTGTSETQILRISLVSPFGATFAGNVRVADVSFSASWDGDVSVPTKNAVYDKIALMDAIDVASFDVANTANLYANLAFMAANAVYGFANTMNINVAATMVVANTANVRANLAQMASNAAYDFANTINAKADYAVLKANQANLLAQTATIMMIIDGGGAALTGGEKGSLVIPFNCRIDQWTLHADQADTVKIDIWSSVYSTTVFPSAANTITNNVYMSLSSARANQSTVMTNWNSTNFNGGNVISYNVVTSGALALQRITVALKVTKT